MTTPTPRPVPTSAPNQRPVQPTGAQPKPKSRLAQVQRGILRVPLRHMFYGPRGVGKSSLGADAPKPLFLDVEGGSPRLNVARYPFRDEPGGHVPRTYEDVLGAVDDLIAHPDHGYLSLVVDTVDALETLIHEFICRRDSKQNVESYGYGKGYLVALAEVRVLLERFDRIIASGVAVILIAHSDEKTYKNPRGPDYDRFRAAMNDKAWGKIAAWCDVVGFVDFEGGGAALKGDESQAKRARGWSTGRRMIQLVPDAAVPDVKCRLSLPAELELAEAHPWQPFAEARDVAQDATPASLAADAERELTRITGIDSTDATTDVEFTASGGRVTTRLAIRKLLTETDDGVLSRVLVGLKSTPSLTANQET